MKSRERFHPDSMRREIAAAHEVSPERRRECVLARLYYALPSLYYFVRRQLAYREAVADLVPGALRTEEVIDHVVVRAYMASTIAEDGDIAVAVRRLALEEILAHLPTDTPQDRPAILYFFHSNGDGGHEPSSSGAAAPVAERQARNDAVRRAFEHSLAGMPAVWRDVMRLHYVDGLARPAVARAVGRSESDVQHMFGHACAYLREQALESREMGRPGPARPD
jgi:DNA-directed RNA polymerase specialized sigma24 family protein